MGSAGPYIICTERIKNYKEGKYCLLTDSNAYKMKYKQS